MPLVAAIGAALYLVAALWLPAAFPVLCGLLVSAAGATALRRRRSRRLRLAVVAAGSVVLVGCLGAAWLAAEPVAGFTWLVAGVFVAPLPLLPWLYARSFAEEEE